MGELEWAPGGHCILGDIRFVSSQLEKFGVCKDPRVLTGSWMYFISHFCNKSSFQSPEITTILLETLQTCVGAPSRADNVVFRRLNSFIVSTKGWDRLTSRSGWCSASDTDLENIRMYSSCFCSGGDNLQSVFSFSFFIKTNHQKAPCHVKMLCTVFFLHYGIISPPLIMLM